MFEFEYEKLYEDMLSQEVYPGDQQMKSYINLLLIEPEKWDLNFLKLAESIGGWSKDPSSKIGSVAVSRQGRILATGYNGFPTGMDDDPEMYADRETKYKYIIHAEQNTIYNACINGVSLTESHVYVWGLPICNECAKGFVQVGVERVVIPASRVFQEDRWLKPFWIAIKILIAGGVKIDVVEGI